MRNPYLYGSLLILVFVFIVCFITESPNGVLGLSESSPTGVELQNKLAIAYIALAGSVIAAIISGIMATLTIKRTKRIDYEFNAYQRIYKECLPHLFTFLRYCEGWPAKFGDIMLHTVNGTIIKNHDELVRFGEQNPANYFKINVFFRIFSPLAAFKILEDKLTSVDLNLDKYLSVQYELGRNLLYSFSKDKKIARKMNPDYSRRDDIKGQGLRGYQIEKLIEFFIDRRDQMNPSVKSFVHFSEQYISLSQSIRFDSDENKYVRNQVNKSSTLVKNGTVDALSNVQEASVEKFDFVLDEFIKLNNIFHNFDPAQNKPILWRILFYHLVICDTILKVDRDRQDSPTHQYTFHNLRIRSAVDIAKQVYSETLESHYNNYLEKKDIEVKNTKINFQEVLFFNTKKDLKRLLSFQEDI